MKRRILIIVENLPVPRDRRVWKEATALQANGYDVTVLCPRGDGHLRGREIIDGIRVYRHPAPKEGNTVFGHAWEYACALFWEVLYTWWIYLSHGFAVIQGCNPPDHIFMVALPFKLFGVKYIFDHHDVTPELYLSKYRKATVLHAVLRAMERLTYLFSDVVIATNNSYKELAIRRGHVHPDKVFVVRNGPDLRSFKAVTPNLAFKRGKPYMIGYVGCINVQDGLDILVDVAEYITLFGRRDICFTCIGGGPELAAVQRMVVNKELEDTITFTGVLSDEEMIEILSTADVCVNPDRPCPMNDISTMIKIMEYMALAKPIVQFESREGRFSAGDASLYADSRNQVVDFANKILWLLEREDERKRMGECGKRRVETALAWEHCVGNLLEAYESVFRQKRPVSLLEQSD